MRGKDINIGKKYIRDASTVKKEEIRKYRTSSHLLTNKKLTISYLNCTTRKP